MSHDDYGLAYGRRMARAEQERAKWDTLVAERDEWKARAERAERDRTEWRLACLKAESERDEWKARAEFAERELSDAFGLPDAVGPAPGEAKRIHTEAIAERDKAKARCREAAQVLTAEVGAPGPENAEETARRAAAHIRAVKAERDRLRRELEALRDYLGQRGTSWLDVPAGERPSVVSEVVDVSFRIDAILDGGES